MKLTIYISLAAAACSTLVAAAPFGDIERAVQIMNELDARGEGDRIEIEKRTPGSKQDPIKITVDCTGVEQVCQADCVAYLCFTAPRLLYVLLDAPNNLQSLIKELGSAICNTETPTTSTVAQAPSQVREQLRRSTISTDLHAHMVTMAASALRRLRSKAPPKVGGAVLAPW